jgi:hypothetical protein
VATSSPNKLTPAQTEQLLSTLQQRFEAHMTRHQGLRWEDVEARLQAYPEKLWSLQEMERTGGQPDVIGPASQGEFLSFWDCSPESPALRRSLCYDQSALESRKTNKPEGSAVGMATDLGVTLLDEEQYQLLQSLGEFDLKTSSWLRTPSGVRERGGAIFGDRRFGRVFIYHNGAESYYAARGFRGGLTISKAP